MKYILIALLMTVASGASARGTIGDCSSTKVIASAVVTQPGFAVKMRRLRAVCDAASARYEATSIEWSYYDRSYNCVVGYFCNGNRGNR